MVSVVMIARNLNFWKVDRTVRRTGRSRRGRSRRGRSEGYSTVCTGIAKMANAVENAATAEQLNYTNPLSSKSDQAHDRLGADMVTRDLLIKASKRIASVWESIARHLDVPEERIKAILCDSNFRNLEKKAYEMLDKWWEKNYKEATEAKLCLALLSEEMTATASDLFGDELVEALKSSKKGKTDVMAYFVFYTLMIIEQVVPFPSPRSSKSSATEVISTRHHLGLERKK